MAEGYRIPAQPVQTELVVNRSRFVTAIRPAATTAEARACIAAQRAAMPAANHHVYAFRVGYGASVNEGMSDAGEPSGTAGPPTLAVLRGSGVGDIALITTRFFGGVKLGKGGLVRAYTASAQAALRALPTERKVEKKTVGLELPYSRYNIVKRLIDERGGAIDDETFDARILIIATFAAPDLARFTHELGERTAGAVQPVALD